MTYSEEDQPERGERGGFLPQALAAAPGDSGGSALPKRRSRPRKLKAPKPNLRLLPDPVPGRAGEDSIDHAGAAIKLYLREIGRVKLLTPREEIELVARVRKGDPKARERLIKGNLRRVTEISAEYENIGLSLLDLISEGNLGLMKAVARFDPTTDAPFSAFSAWWIKQSIKRALARSSQKPAS